MKIDLKLLKKGDRLTLSKALTLIESTKTADQNEARKLLSLISKNKTSSIRLAITGAPGVGKSTLIDTLGSLLVESKKRVAVLAIDPSSPIHGGSLLGDKTRMEKLSQSKNAFIRPSPSKGVMGGVAPRTLEAILLCEAAGFDYIIVETVGVGQSETSVSTMVDLTLLLLNPGGGDDLQGIKKGIMEVADMIVVNKADHNEESLAKQTAADYQSALSLLMRQETPKVLTISALFNHGIIEVKKEIDELVANKMKDQSYKTKRDNQALDLFWRHLEFGLKTEIRKIISDDKILKDPLGIASRLLSKIIKTLK